MSRSAEPHEAMPQDLERKRQEMVARGELDPRVAEAMRQMDRLEYQDENGVDLTLIRENLKRTPSERLDRHYRFRQGVLEMPRHARRITSTRGPRDD